MRDGGTDFRTAHGRSIAAGLALAAVALLSGPASAGAAPGELDATFGVDGRYFADVGTGDGAPDIAVDSQGRVLAVFSDTSDAAGVIRVLSDGGTDESFGSGGIARSAGHTIGARVAVDGLDRVIIAAYVPTGGGNVAAGLVRFNAAGDLDDDFDGNGSKGIGNIVPTVLEARHDGRILYQGDAGDQIGNSLVVVQLNDDGSRNTSFGTNGRAVMPLPAGASNARVTEISIGAGGNVAVLGTYTSGGNTRRAVGMLTPGGDPDTGFAGTGVITMSEAWRSLAADSSGGVLMTREYSESSAPWRTLVVRLGGDGQLDTDFGSAGGMAVDATPGWQDLPEDIDIGPAGQIAVTGGGSGPSEPDFFTVIQLTADGLPDAGFGQNGVFWDASGRPAEGAYDPAGNIVATQGSLQPPPARDFGVRLVRLQGSGSTDPGDGGGDSGSGGVAGDVASSKGRGLVIHRFVSPPSLEGIVKKGMRALVSCERACRAVLKVKVPKGTARDLGLSGRVIGRGEKRLKADRRRWMKLRVTPEAAPALSDFVGRISFKVSGRGLAP
jgi:uncharacterized delta-60 repeat protein